MKRIRPDNIVKVIDHCRDENGRAIFADLDVKWIDGRLKMPTVSGWKTMSVDNDLLDMDNWKLLIEEPKDQEWARVEGELYYFEPPTDQIALLEQSGCIYCDSEATEYICTGFKHEGTKYPQPQAIMWKTESGVCYLCKSEERHNIRSVATHAVMEEVE